MIQWSMSSHFHYHSHPGLVSGNWPKPLLCKSPRTPPWRTAIRSYSEWSAHVVTTFTQLCRGWQPHHKKLVHFEPKRTKIYGKMTWLRNCKLQTATIYASTFININHNHHNMEVQSNVNSPSTVAFVLPSWAPIFGSSVLPLQVVGKGFRLLMPHKFIKGNTSQLSRKIKRPVLICWMMKTRLCI